MTTVNKLSLSIVIPTLNAEHRIGALIESLLTQTIKATDILIVDSSSQDATVERARAYRGVEIHVIDRSQFNHGLTRDWALRNTSGDIVCFLSDDALPVNSEYLAEIGHAFDDPRVGVAYARQLPLPGTRHFEVLIRERHYGPHPRTDVEEDSRNRGLLAYFNSDSASAYRRSAYMEVGGFPAVPTNEDMLLARRLLKAGYSKKYVPSAMVRHSHRLTASEQFRRNRLVGRFFAEYGKEFAHVSATGTGLALVSHVARRLIAEGHFMELPALACDAAARWLGLRVGYRDVLKGRPQ